MNLGGQTDVYVRLRKRLDELATGYPATPGGVELRILRELFTEHDAGLFLHMDMHAQSVGALASRIGGEAAELAAQLEDMAGRGLIYREEHADGPRYRIMPFNADMCAYPVNRNNPGFAQCLREYYHTALSRNLVETRIPPMRVIPVNPRLTWKSGAARYDDARAIIHSKQHIAVTPCLCRVVSRLGGKGCNHSLETCLKFDDHADYYVRNKMGRFIGTQEALQILKQCERENLVLQVMNSQRVEGICAGCACCCGILMGLRHFSKTQAAVRNNHVCALDVPNCNGCGACTHRCPVGALTLGKDRVELNPARCIGCGLCVDACIVNALSLERKAENDIYTPPATIEDTYVLMARERLQSTGNEED